MKRFELGRDEQRGRDHSHVVSGDVKSLSRRYGRRVPPVAEAKNALVHRHDIDDEIVTAPPAERRAGRRVLGEPQRAQPFRERGVLRIGRDVNDHVDIFRGRMPPAAGSVMIDLSCIRRRIPVRRAPARGGERPTRRARDWDQPRSSLRSRALNSFSASCRSRTRPSRNASISALAARGVQGPSGQLSTLPCAAA
jgi:hypothetical protein